MQVHVHVKPRSPYLLSTFHTRVTTCTHSASSSTQHTHIHINSSPPSLHGASKASPKHLRCSTGFLADPIAASYCPEIRNVWGGPWHWRWRWGWVGWVVLGRLAWLSAVLRAG